MVVGTAGDSLLVEFASAVAAVECAVAVQWGMIERNADQPQRRTLRTSSNVRSGFTRRSRGRLQPPPGLECTGDAGSGGQGRGWLSGTLELRSEPAEPQDTHRFNYCLPISLKARPQYLVNFVLLSLKQFKTRSSPNLTSGQYFSASAPH